MLPSAQKLARFVDGSWNAPRAHRFRKILQRLAADAGFHVGRMPPNRFEATEDVLKALKQRAFNPQLIIDAGANVGDWTRFARTLFPAAECHMIEPQPACRGRLADLERRDARVHLRWDRDGEMVDCVLASRC